MSEHVPLHHRVMRSIRSRGVVGSLRFAVEHFRFLLDHHENQAFDHRYGVDTSARVRVTELEIPHQSVQHASGYQPVGPRMFRNTVRHVRRRLSDHEFLDLGSGKGRALLLASSYPFRRIVGVEVSAELCKVAQRNVATFVERTGRGTQIEIVCDDVQNHRLPDSPLLVFLYNPFGRPIVVTVLRRLDEWLHSGGHDLVLIYLNPVFADELDAQPFLRRLRSRPDYIIYEGVR